jgi:hypothetical protein
MLQGRIEIEIGANREKKQLLAVGGTYRDVT